MFRQPPFETPPTPRLSLTCRFHRRKIRAIDRSDHIARMATHSPNMATTNTAEAGHPPKMAYGEIVSFAYDTFCSDKLRFTLTALGMVIGTSSLILVVTIAMTGKKYVLDQIQGIGVNMIVVEYQGGDHGSAFLT